MAQHDDPPETESAEIIDEFLRRDLVPEDVADRARRLRDEGDPEEALELVLEARKDDGAGRPGRRVARTTDQ